MTNTINMARNEELKIERMLRELQSDMADLVASGEMTPEQANQWVNDKADQWANGLS
jgi:polyhydroxyalkanoate synthesis regulator phasin